MAISSNGLQDDYWARRRTMRVFVAGATGAIGRRLIPQLIAAGYDVTGSTRSESKTQDLKAAGADAVIVDGLNHDNVLTAVGQAQPDVVIHQLSALSEMSNLKKFDEEFEVTNQLRTKGLDNLIDAARAVGAKRFIAQSYTGWTNPRTGNLIKTEEDPLDPEPAAASRKTLNAISYLEESVAESEDFEGLALRYGAFYGPGTGLAPGGGQAVAIQKRQFPIVGKGEGLTSFIHLDDAASATVKAVEHGAPGRYNIVDDEPAQQNQWLPVLAEALGAKPPRKLPAWLVKPMIGEFGVNMMTAARGSSNAKAKQELGWELTYPTWRRGFRNGL
jgi:nucleoside-diphosphate-sugar epimerase